MMQCHQENAVELLLSCKRTNGKPPSVKMHAFENRWYVSFVLCLTTARTGKNSLAAHHREYSSCLKEDLNTVYSTSEPNPTFCPLTLLKFILSGHEFITPLGRAIAGRSLYPAVPFLDKISS